MEGKKVHLPPHRIPLGRHQWREKKIHLPPHRIPLGRHQWRVRKYTYPLIETLQVDQILGLCQLVLIVLALDLESFTDRLG